MHIVIRWLLYIDIYFQCRLKVAGGPGPHFHMGPLTIFPAPSFRLNFIFVPSTSLTYYPKQKNTRKQVLLLQVCTLQLTALELLNALCNALNATQINGRSLTYFSLQLIVVMSQSVTQNSTVGCSRCMMSACDDEYLIMITTWNSGNSQLKLFLIKMVVEWVLECQNPGSLVHKQNYWTVSK